ncbi:hydroxyethylthiazole kinase [Salisediminibacterium halotolerans]|uniref:hydroxyethylthiazole kinase n=1 Tax=Salisediminibacterium halotolerans TaxID=517425 RepID=UPI000EB4E51B|nr:hydroxyethylthiazole kinase [Salisediminibacterium halotolerans]RLJ71808.1 hydroxyethylthiazole kinase [Actinophytocola xinjiangensis]RPE86958.1 hydroxyethylthiazole kinase [Salisediminibacterium halotolerans]TWG33021.1 hydroxyethylthiazole kinase [Salisediminibacterium halotolerans]GEL08918.1 hydroxyethylthiazole kinase [Salisediminibacterium halotolerans]
MLSPSEMRKRITEKPPLVHNMTNVVVTNFTANGLYALGAKPVMANAIEEVTEMAGHADALSLNIGTLTSEQVEAMLTAGKAANKAGTPVVFDPVGVGATTFRDQTAKRLLAELDVDVIRGNEGEIARLAGIAVTVRGVDSENPVENAEEAAIQTARTFSALTVMTGETDIVTDGETIVYINNGHSLQSSVTGTGCLLSSVIGAFASRGDNLFDAACAAVSYYGSAAEKAAADKTIGPGTFQVRFLDQLALISDDDLSRLCDISERKQVQQS